MRYTYGLCNHTTERASEETKEVQTIELHQLTLLVTVGSLSSEVEE